MEKPSKEFWDRSDAYIDLANEQSKSVPSSTVSASLLFAAARFNSFIVASNTKTLEELQADKDRAVEYFSEQYKKMLVENIDDYISNYSKYMGSL